jgi:hypothetical protein
MNMNLEQLKKNFGTIKDIRNKVTNIFQILEEHLKKLKQTYAEFVLNNKQNLFVFGLDSFQFQSKLIDIEYDDMKRMFLAINNRMYCEYYKLYKIVVEYVKEYITDKKTLELVKTLNTFPVYKDLEPYRQYNFELIQELHEHIILLLYGISDYIQNKENELQLHQKKQEIGLNINNFVTTFNFNIIMVKEKGMLFISYLDFFHTLHTKYLQRFSMKMNLIYSQVTHDIRFEDTPQPSELKKKDLLNTYQEDNIDKSLLKQIKRSIDDSDSNLSDSPSRSGTLDQIILSPTNKTAITDEQQYNSSPLKINIEEKTKETISNLTNQTGLSSVFKKNIKKVMTGGMNMFKYNKKNDSDNISSSSNDSTTNILKKEISNTITNGQQSITNGQQSITNGQQSITINNSSVNKNNTNVFSYTNYNEDNIISYGSEYSNDIALSSVIDDTVIFGKPVSDEDEAELQRTLSSENIFMEISKQCLEITNPINTESYIQLKEEVKEVKEVEAEVKVKEVKEVEEEVKEEEVKEEEVKEEEVKEENSMIFEETKEEEILDDNISILTIENFTEQKDDDTSKDTEQKKKRQYKPRKKKI